MIADASYKSPSLLLFYDDNNSVLFSVLLFQIGAHSPLQSKEPAHTHTHTHARTHARTHAHTHTHTQSIGQLAEVRFQRIKMKDVSDRTVKSSDYLNADRTVKSKNHHRDIPDI